MANFVDPSNKDLTLARSRTGQPPRTPGGKFVHITHETCPDCNLRGALTRTTLRPLRDHDPFRKRALKEGRTVGIRFNPATVDACETCRGTGQVLRARPGDPYDRDAMYPVEAAKRKKKRKK